MLSINCPYCRTLINAPPEMAGKTGRCPKCKGNFLVPVPQPAEQPWYAAAVAQAAPAVKPAPPPVAAVVPPAPQPPVAKVVPPQPPVAAVAKVDEGSIWANFVHGGLLGVLVPKKFGASVKQKGYYARLLDVAVLVAVVVGVVLWLNSGPSTATVEKEARRIMNENGLDISSVELVKQEKNRYVGTAQGGRGRYSVTVTCDGDKILVNYLPVLNWP